jgi:serine/threonine-protein kinase HipA
MLRLLNELSSRPAQDVAEYLNRFVAFILMGNTDAHLKNWALLYPDAKQPVLSPIYDPVCVSALFEHVPVSDYGLNKAIDHKLKAFSWTDFESMVKAAGMMRVSHHVRQAKLLVKEAKEKWPTILKDAPPAVGRSVTQRINGSVALT